MSAGFAKAENDIFIILDADMTVMPESLPSFIDALLWKTWWLYKWFEVSLSYWRRSQRFLNILGNNVWYYFSYLVNQ